MIKPLSKQHAQQIALLHIRGIPTGFISSLGEKFVTSLYESIADSPYGFGCVEEDDDGKVVGFVAFSKDLGKLYKTICMKNGTQFILLLAGKLISLKRIKKIFETLFYPNRVERPNLPKAELLSIAVNESQRGKGIAQALIEQGLNQCSRMGIHQVKVMVADFNAPANRLYQKTGFTLICQIENHGIVSNVYVTCTDHFAKSQ